MTPLHDKFDSLGIDRSLKELVKMECAMKKHFVYIDHIDELRHNERVIKDFDNAIRVVRNLIRKLRIFRSNLINQ